jgi:hypothetical protein
MPLCPTMRSCGCAVTSNSLTISGDGSPGNPWALEGATPQKGTRAARLALAGASLYEGLEFWETDFQQLWIYSLSLASWRQATNPNPANLYGTNRIMGPSGRFFIAANSEVITTNASGLGVINYGVIFVSLPLVVACGGDYNTPVQVNLNTTTSTTADMGFQARNASGALIVSTTVRLNWAAIGFMAS